MAEYEDNLRFLRSSERYPKVNRRPIQDPKSQIGSDEYNRIVGMLTLLNVPISGNTGGGSGGILKKYTMREYLDMAYRGELVNTFYTVYKDGELYRIYLGETLIMKKKTEQQEQVTFVGAFPFVFPIIFP